MITKTYLYKPRGNDWIEHRRLIVSLLSPSAAENLSAKFTLGSIEAMGSIKFNTKSFIILKFYRGSSDSNITRLNFNDSIMRYLPAFPTEGSSLYFTITYLKTGWGYDCAGHSKFESSSFLLVTPITDNLSPIFIRGRVDAIGSEIRV